MSYTPFFPLSIILSMKHIALVENSHSAPCMLAYGEAESDQHARERVLICLMLPKQSRCQCRHFVIFQFVVHFLGGSCADLIAGILLRGWWLGL